MVITKELIKKQKADSKIVDGKYTVVVKGAGVVNKEKPVLKTLLPGVRLRFLRYGMFLKQGEHKAAAIRVKGDKDEVFTITDADVSNGELNTTRHFTVGATTVNEGYIYLINPKDDTDCHELYVKPDGTMSHIIWDETNFYKKNNTLKDKRTPEKDSILYKRIVNNKKDKFRSFWVGYSTVQWTHKHFENVMNMSDSKKKELHMVFVEAKGIKKGEETAQEHVLPFNKVQFAYHKNDPIKNKFAKQLKQIAATERNESKKGKNEVLEDMFITLHDPIGAVEDIADELAYLYSKQETIVEALQNGETYEQVAKRKENGKEKKTFSNDEKQLQYLFQTALTTYHLVYGSDKMERDYSGGKTGYWNTDFKGNGVDKVKVEHILGVKYRKKIRKNIRALKNELYNLMHTNYYKNIWKHYQTNVDDYILDGKFRCSSHIALLGKTPHAIDRHLDLKKNYEDNDDKWEDFFTETLSFDHDHPLNKLLDTPVELFFLTGPVIDLENKLGGVIRNLTESYAQKIITTEYVTKTITEKVPKTKTVTKTTRTKGYKDVFFKRLQKFELGGSPIIEIQKKEIEAEFKGSRYELDNPRIKFVGYKPQQSTLNKAPKDRSPQTRWRIDDQNRILIARMKLTDEVVLKQQLRGKNHVKLPVIEHKTTKEIIQYIEEVEKTFTKPVDKEIFKRKHGELAEKLFNSKVFTGALALLQVFNALNAASAISDKKDYKNIVNTAGITAELIEASLHIKRASLINKGIMSSQSFGKTFSGRALGFSSFMGSTITVLMCVWETFDSQNARDYDAMWAWAGAGAAWGTFFFASGMGFTPMGIVVGGIAIGLTALAYYLKDTPLEAYFKNNILSDAIASPKGAIGKNPWAYIRDLYNDRDNQIPEPNSLKFWAKDEFKKWENMHTAYQDLLDILVCANIRFTPTKLQLREKLQPWTSTLRVNIEISDIISYRATISFRQFLTSPDQLEYDVYYFENGLDTTPKPLTIKEQQITIDKTKGQIPKAIIDFTVYKNELTNNNKTSYIVFVCRLALEKNKYYPIDINGEDRYIGAKFTTQEEVREIQKGLFSKKVIKDSDYQGPVAINTLSKLLSKKVWYK